MFQAMQLFGRLWRASLVFALASISLANSARAADTLIWHTNENRVTADIQSVPLIRLLEGVSQLTGWHVYLESNATHTASAKFKDLPSGEALRSLLGNLNFALVPQTNSRSRLYVFHSSQRNATMLVAPGDLNGGAKKSARIPNELVITLKRGSKIENLACLQNAKITGRLDALNTYRLTFENEAATQAARDCLANNSEVASIDSNFNIDGPQQAQQLDSNIAPDLNLKLKDSSSDCNPIIALIDTRVDSLGADLDKFLMPAISVVKTSSGNSSDVTPHSSQISALNHGTAMAETMLRSLHGTTSGGTSVKILPVDVYGNNSSTTTFDVAQGIYQAVNSGANIINLSLGSSGDSTALHDLITRASQQGVVFFAAAGNEPVTTPVYPAAYPEVIAVTAGDRNGQIASYANRGSFVDIMTPGTSLVPFAGQSYIVNGTSAATAYASGIAAGLANSSGDCPPTVISTMRSKLGVTLGNGQ
jgi:hypothetical protein